MDGVEDIEGDENAIKKQHDTEETPTNQKDREIDFGPDDDDQDPSTFDRESEGQGADF